MGDDLIVVKAPNFFKNCPSSTKDSSINVIDFDVDTPIHIHVQESRKHPPNRNPVARPGEKHSTVVPVW